MIEPFVTTAEGHRLRIERESMIGCECQRWSIGIHRNADEFLLEYAAHVALASTHEVTVDANGYRCSCGETFDAMVGENTARNAMRAASHMDPCGRSIVMRLGEGG